MDILLRLLFGLDTPGTPGLSSFAFPPPDSSYQGGSHPHQQPLRPSSHSTAMLATFALLSAANVAICTNDRALGHNSRSIDRCGSHHPPTILPNTPHPLALFLTHTPHQDPDPRVSKRLQDMQEIERERERTLKNKHLCQKKTLTPDGSPPKGNTASNANRKTQRNHTSQFQSQGNTRTQITHTHTLPGKKKDAMRALGVPVGY